MNTDIAVTPAAWGCPAVDDTSARTTVATTPTPTATNRPRQGLVDAGDLGTRSWTAQAACLGADPDVFFSETNATATTAAQKLCRSCPVQLVCLDYALTTGQRDGIWGNTTARQRRQHQRRQAA